MVDINWEEAPEGTTHAFLNIEKKAWWWRKVVNGQVCSWDEGWGDPWHDNAAAWLNQWRERIEVKPHAPEQPQVVVINGVEVDWGKAPEGATHAATDLAAIRVYGQWRKLENNTVSDWKGGEWVERMGIEPDKWKHANRGGFIEKPGLVAAAPVVKKEEPKPITKKAPVGWWN